MTRSDLDKLTSVPVLAIAGIGEDDPAWREGCEEIIAAPFRAGSLLDRIDRYKRPHYLAAHRGTLEFAGLRFVPEDSVIYKGPRALRLTEKECTILMLLYDKGGAVIDRQTLLDDVWEYAADVETHTLETHIYRLRRKIEDDPGQPCILVTDDQGYRLHRD